jgi:bis(5'-nucleosyl)-tetraphosphatase (symmetrical)
MIALDTGYVWGNHMTLMNLDTQVRFCCDNEGLVSQFDELAFAVKSAKL